MGEPSILLVDDDEALRDIVTNQLSAQGYRVDEAADGADALAKLQTTSYDVMLLDINMPQKSGIDVLKHVKDNGLKCKIIMLTGRVGFSIAMESLKLGADEYITKPFSFDYLVDAIKRVLAKQ